MEVIKNAIGLGGAQGGEPISKEPGTGTAPEPSTIETIKNAIGLGSTEVQSGEEPISGETGSGTATEPYDAGNVPGQSGLAASETTKATTSSNPHSSDPITDNPSSTPIDHNTSVAKDVSETQPTSSARTFAMPDSAHPYTLPNDEPSLSSGQNVTQGLQGADRPLGAPSNEQNSAIVGEKAQTENTQAGGGTSRAAKIHDTEVLHGGQDEQEELNVPKTGEGSTAVPGLNDTSPTGLASKSGESNTTEAPPADPLASRLSPNLDAPPQQQSLTPNTNSTLDPATATGTPSPSSTQAQPSTPSSSSTPSKKVSMKEKIKGKLHLGKKP